MSEKFTVLSKSKKLLADTYTPVGVYARLRENFPITFLLESSDYHSHENSLSFICAEPLASITVANNELKLSVNGKAVETQAIATDTNVATEIDRLLQRFSAATNGHQLPHNSFFGYTCYDAIQYFENIEISGHTASTIPEIQYHLFRYVLVFNHFKEELFLFKNKQ